MLIHTWKPVMIPKIAQKEATASHPVRRDMVLSVPHGGGSCDSVQRSVTGVQRTGFEKGPRPAAPRRVLFDDYFRNSGCVFRHLGADYCCGSVTAAWVRLTI